MLFPQPRPLLITPPRLWKPGGQPCIVPQQAPRGLIFCFPFTDPSWAELLHGGVAATAGLTARVTPVGWGAYAAAAATGGTNAVYTSVPYNAQPPSTWSIEAYFFQAPEPSAAGGYICGFNQSADGSNTTWDRQLLSNASYEYSAYLYDGASQFAASPTVTAVGMQHVVGTCDGSNLRVYWNGALQATTTVANGGFTGYTLPVYFVVGRSGTVSTGVGYPDQQGGANITNLLVNFSNVCWSASEVLSRYSDPFGFLEWPRGRAFLDGSVISALALLARSPAVAKSRPLSIYNSPVRTESIAVSSSRVGSTYSASVSGVSNAASRTEPSSSFSTSITSKSVSRGVAKAPGAFAAVLAAFAAGASKASTIATSAALMAVRSASQSLAEVAASGAVALLSRAVAASKAAPEFSFGVITLLSKSFANSLARVNTAFSSPLNIKSLGQSKSIGPINATTGLATASKSDSTSRPTISAAISLISASVAASASRATLITSSYLYVYAYTVARSVTRALFGFTLPILGSAAATDQALYAASMLDQALYSAVATDI